VFVWARVGTGIAYDPGVGDKPAGDEECILLSNLDAASGRVWLVCWNAADLVAKAF
jgi:hypothetical protein